jgi:phage tail-like protein
LDDIRALFKLTGPNLNRDEITVSKEGLRVGRTPDNDLPLDHREISRQHMRIFWESGEFWVEDMNSSNGVWVNDLRIRPNIPHPVKRGDIIRCGPYVFTFLRLIIPPPAELSAPPPEPEIVKAPESFAEIIEQLLPFTDPPPSPLDTLTPVEVVADEGYPVGIPRDQSTWMQYLPAIYSEDDFIGRYLLISESVLSPIIWMIDNFDMYLSPEVAPAAWLQWMASWFDLIVVPELPIERQRAIMGQAGWLFLRRSTRMGLERLLELYFGVKPEIIESKEDACHFTVRLPLSQSTVRLGREVADRLIMSQKPAFASYTLEIS